jgi:AAA domain
MDMGCSLETTVDLMSEHWDHRNSPPWDDELLHQVGSLATSRQEPIGSKVRTDVEAIFEPVELAPPSAALAEMIAARRAARIRADAAKEPGDGPTLITPHESLSVAAWLDRQIPPKQYLLGNVFHQTSRWMLYGDTGVGKTLFALEMAGAMAAGHRFLDWEGSGRPARVMYLDGEISADTFKERIATVARKYGCNIPLFAFNRDVLGEGEMGPLNTEAGQGWLWRAITAVGGLDAILFDSLAFLTTGDKTAEDSGRRFNLSR